jgi:hypothetical protein
METVKDLYQDQGLSLARISEITGKSSLMILSEVDSLGLIRRDKTKSAENGWLQRRFNKLKREQLND